MDAVITYVNMNDPLWRQDYASTGKSLNVKRFRDWGTLKYLLRGIEVNMPFIENVFLVVSRESQVPHWADTSRLQIILHRDIIPERFLPVFNSTAIEMFLHRIPGLSEQFIYFNDDFFPVLPCKEEDFFEGNRIRTGFSHHLFALNLYKKQTRNASNLAREALGLPRSRWYIRPQHTCCPMLRSSQETLFKAVEGAILDSVTPLRSSININQYLYTDYLYYSGAHVPGSNISSRHFSVGVHDPETVAAFIAHPDRQIACINDVNISEERFPAYRSALDSAFAKRFPRKSRFER